MVESERDSMTHWEGGRKGGREGGRKGGREGGREGCVKARRGREERWKEKAGARENGVGGRKEEGREGGREGGREEGKEGGRE
jgi:hypothetical protein